MKTVRFACALAAALVPFLFAVRGTDWTEALHHDEAAMCGKMRDFARTLKASRDGDVYPEGFFALANLYRKTVQLRCRAERFCSSEPDGRRSVDEVRTVPRDPAEPTVRTGRHVNALLAGLCGLFLFLAVLEATGSAAGGLCAAFLGACSPHLVEHAHYCETDLAFPAATALALWLLFGALKRRSAGRLAGAAAACAAAFACKYTVAPLVPFCAAVWFALAFRSVREAGADRAERRRRLGRAVLAGLLCAAAGAAGYAAFTPLCWVDPADWASRIFRIWGNTRGSAVSNDIAESAAGKPSLSLYIARAIRNQFLEAPPAWLACAAAGAVAAFPLRRRCPAGLWTAALAVLFAAFFVRCAPWFRSQEFIPFVLLGSVLAGLAAGAAAAAAARWKNRLARAAVPCAAVAVAAAASAPGAMRTAAGFATRDTRIEMRRWLEQSAPADRFFCANRYANRVLASPFLSTSSRFGEPEEFWAPGVEPPADVDYFARQTYWAGRGYRDGETGELLPVYAAGRTNFEARAVLLREWKRTPGWQLSFAQLPMELWGVVPDGARFVRAAPFGPRATAWRMGGEPYDAAQGGDLLGAADAIRVVGRRSSVRFVPPPGGKPVWAVVRHVAGDLPAEIRWESLFSPRRAVVGPGAARAFRYVPSATDGFGDVLVRTRVRMKGDDQTCICLATVTADPLHAAELLARGGAADEAAALLESAGLPPDPAAAFAAAAPALPDRFWRDFARVRFGDATVFLHGGDDERDQPGEDGAVRLDSEFPLLFEPGRYRVSFRLPFEGPRVRSAGFSGSAETAVLSGAGFVPGGRVELEQRFDRTVPARFAAAVEPWEGSSALFLRDLEIRWEPATAAE